MTGKWKTSISLEEPKDLKEAVCLAADFEANLTARMQRQSITVGDQRGVRSISETNEVLGVLKKNKRSSVRT